jgi:glycosyltransferase involved in cell wall biosynthesis
VKTSNIAKVSVFLPIYNKEKFLFRSINSIQSQSLKNIEIIAVNDGSTDNSLKILRKLSKKDKRIKLINNDRNHGLLYSRAMGIINSSGEYLLNLDPDDKLESNSDLKILYNKAKKSKLDYILYLLKRVPRFKSEIKDCKLRNQLQLQSEDFLITNKFIKRKILLKAYKFFKSDIYKFKWDYHEDNIWNILTRVYGQTNKIVNKYIYIC